MDVQYIRQDVRTTDRQNCRADSLVWGSLRLAPIMLQLDSNSKQTIYIDWGSLSTNHKLVLQNSSSSKYRRFDCWAAVFFRADINAGTGKISLQLAYQLLSRRDVLTESIVQTESRWSLITENNVNTNGVYC